MDLFVCYDKIKKKNFMELKKIIEENWDKNKFISLSLNQEIKNKIISETSFLDKYYKKIQLRNRAYVIINEITEDTLPKCKCGCGKIRCLDITNAVNGFREYSGPECSRKDKTIPKNVLEKLKDKDWLFEERITKQKSIENIADELNISHIPVKKWIKYHNIDNVFDARKRNTTANIIFQDKEKLKKLYESGLTCEEIAKQITSTKSTVSRWLSFYGIETRESNEYDRKIITISSEEKEVLFYISSIYDGQIQSSNRSILKGKELDIYLPDKNIAIEYNGLYSHSYKPWESKESLIKGPKYHLNKTILCEQNNIQLIHLYSDEWINKNEIIKSILKTKIGLNQKIYARNCKIINVDTHTKNIFLNQYHIQGEDKSKLKLGLLHEDELVCVMTFTKSRFNNNYDWELSRFCTKINYNIVGGFSKLLSHFKKYNTGSIISYADRRYSRGDVYIKNGFTHIRTNSPSYYYVDKNYTQRYNRMKFQKKYIGAYSGTEYERARELGYNKIYDCGTLAFGLL